MKNIKENILDIAKKINNNIQNNELINKSKVIIEKNKTNTKMLTVLITISCVILLYIGYLAYTYNKSNVVSKKFFKNITSTDSTIQDIPKNKLYKRGSSNEYSFSLWFRINNWNSSSISEENHIFTFGEHYDSGIPSLFLKTDINDIVIKVKTLVDTDKIILKNVPIKKWFKITVVMKAKSVQIYLNSKLVVYKLLSDKIISHTGGVQLFKDKKIDGYFSNFTFYPKALSPSVIANLYDIGDKPIKQSFLYSLINKIINIGQYHYDKILLHNKNNEDCQSNQ